MSNKWLIYYPLFFIAIIIKLYKHHKQTGTNTKNSHSAVPSVQIDTYDKRFRLICRIPENSNVCNLNEELLQLINTELKKKKINLDEFDILKLKHKIKIKYNFVIIKLIVCKKNKCNCC